MILIAIDGPSASGKGTIARYLAKKYHLKHIDSGLLYRSIARGVIQNKINQIDTVALQKFIDHHQFGDLTDLQLRDEAVANVTSIISVHPFIREKVDHYMHDEWNNLTEPYHGMIVDGRDIGTVVFPQASLKLFIIASDEARAQRRLLEGDNQRHQNIQEMIQQRDQRDQQRLTAPLKPADDAHIIDTSNLSPEEACQAAEKVLLTLIARG